MPITKSAKKTHKQSLVRRARNLRRKRAMKEAVKNVTAETLPAAYKAIDKAAQRGVIKKNTAARKKSRAARAIARAK